MLFPYDVNSGHPAAYYYAIELARRINNDLAVISANRPVSKGKILFRKNLSGNNSEINKQLHLNILELNGRYLQDYNQWIPIEDIKVKAHSISGSIDEILYTLLRQKTGSLLLVEYRTFTEILIPKDFLNKAHSTNYKLWIIPDEIEGFKANPQLVNEFFAVNKRDVFAEYLCQTKLYNMPNDINLVRSDFSISELAL